MLSAYHFSKDPIFLSKAKELGDILMPAFNTASKLPLASINFARREAVAASFNGGASSTAEVATLQLEFKYLSALTNDPKYWKAVEQVMLVLESLPKVDGLVPIFINPISGKFEGAEIRMGSRGDSYYEYLLKQYIQTNRTETAYRRAWDESMNGVKRRLISHSKPHNLTFVGELPQGANSHTIYPKMDHLVCFLGGALALGASPDGRLITDRTKLTPLQQADLQLGEELTHTCYMTYKVQATGLAPEIVYFNTEPDKDTDIEVRPLDAHNLLRPETVESLFVLWRITGDVKYREWGWEIFQNFVKYCRVGTGGYTSLVGWKWRFGRPLLLTID
jgi:mannosyl-oligosaccharide alpha-1,2-mannosidase